MAFSQAGLLGDEGEGAIRGDDHIRPDGIFVRTDASHPAILEPDAVNLIPGDNQGALLAGLLGQPLVKFPPQHGDAVCPVSTKTIAGQLYRDSARCCHHGQAFFDHFALEWSIFEELGQVGAHRLQVQTTACHIFAARVIPALNDQYLDAGRRKHIRGG
jgi:hypothetical protein